ncbi:MAG: thioredoxin family protein [Longimicrobiales bacterium]
MRERFRKARTFQEFLSGLEGSRHPWRELYRRAHVPGDLMERGRDLEETWHLLALSEEWCGDGANSLPYLARLAEVSPNLELRILSRDENPDLMDRHLTDGSRSIPVVMVLDEGFREVGWWGPRPSPLQDIFLREIKPLPEPERYPRLRAWYARDRGRTVLEEVLGRIPVSV